MQPGDAAAAGRAEDEAQEDPPGPAIRRPVAEDGAAVHRLIAACPPLDPNSLYCNLIQCRDFAETCALATQGGEVVGFVSGYVPPPRPETLFIWQVAVGAPARGRRLGQRLMRHILDRPRQRRLRYLEATVTASNAASKRMFESLAADLSAPIRFELVFDSQRHFEGAHESEHLLTIGPF